MTEITCISIESLHNAPSVRCAEGKGHEQVGPVLASWFRYSFDNGPEGDVVLNVKIAQSGVGEQFRMLVPIYLELADGRIVRLGRVSLAGNTTMEQKVPLKGLKDRPRRVITNYMYDVLASN